MKQALAWPAQAPDPAARYENAVVLTLETLVWLNRLKASPMSDSLQPLGDRKLPAQPEVHVVKTGSRERIARQPTGAALRRTSVAYAAGHAAIERARGAGDVRRYRLAGGHGHDGG